MESQSEIEKLQAQIQKLTLERDEALARAEHALSKTEEKETLKPSTSKLSQRVAIKTILKKGKSLVGQRVVVCGWARTIREQGGGRFVFIELNDGSCFKNIQVVFHEGKPGWSDVQGRECGTGACLVCVGEIKECTGKQEIEMHADEVELHGKCVPGNYPLAAKKKLELDYLRTIAHLRGRTNTFGAVMRVRNACAMATHLFFQSQGFLYLHTPIITASDAEGAGEMFQLTNLLKGGSAKLADVPVVKETGKPDYSQDFFAKPAFLTVSGQLNGEMYATALGKIYTFGPTFRAENAHTSRHLAEFWMIEPEIAFADLDENMDMAEAYLKYVIKHVMDNCMEDLQFFDQWVEKGIIERLRKVYDTPFKRLTYTEAVDILLKSGKKFEFPVAWGVDLQSEHERYITEQVFNQPVILTDYPKDIKAFYMKLSDDGKTVRAMDVLVPRIGEIIGGSQREERLEVLEKRMEECKLDKEAYRHYLDLRRFGSCVHSGFGLGFERLVMFATGIANIKDVIPFPRSSGHADF